MKNLIFFLLLFGFIHANGQTTFNHQYDLFYSFEVFTSVLPTDSCYYVTGVIANGGPTGNIFLKLDLNGEIEFEKKLSSFEKHYETWWGDLITAPDGNFLDVGTTSDSTTKILLVKYDDNGDTIFTKEYFHPLYPASALVYSAEIRMDSDSNLFILCRVDSDALQNEKDVYLLKLDQEGGVLDSFLFGNPIAEIPSSMILDTDGLPIIGSQRSNKQQIIPNHFSRAHIFKTDGNGGILWEYETPNSQLTDAADDIILTSGGGIVVASGKGIDYFINSTSSQLRWNSYIFKLGPDHQMEWDTELRGFRHSASTGLTKIVEAHDGSGYIATGRLIEDATTGETEFGAWLVKVSPQGDSLWGRYYTVFDSIAVKSQPYDLKKTPDGGYVIVGDTSPQLPTGQAQRAWIMKLDQHGCLIPGCEEGDTVISTIDLPVAAQVRLAIHPNPTSDFLNFQLRGAQQVQAATFRIVSASGQVLREINSGGARDTHIVPVSGWGAGVYFLQYMVAGEVRASEGFVVLE